MLTAPQLCELVDRPYPWFESRRRRARDMFAPASGADAAALDAASLEYLPVKSLEPGRHGRYDAEDALLLAIALEGEAMGLTFGDATRIAINAGAATLLKPKKFKAAIEETADDMFAARVWFPDGQVGHVAGTFSDVLLSTARRGGPPTRAVAINISIVLRRLHERAEALGLAAALGWAEPEDAPTPRKDD